MTDAPTSAPADLEDVESFRQRARTWLAANMPRAVERNWGIRGTDSDEEELAEIAHNRRLQRLLFDGGFAGICFPRDYGGQGLTPAHQHAFNEELSGYDWPDRIQIPTFSPCGSVLLQFATDEQKRAHIPALLRGDEIWMQFLSEPSGGSDVAGAQTTAVRDGDEWILNGSKIWTTGAWWSDWALALVRTDWDLPKHRGLTVFMLKIRQPGIEIHRIEMLNGSKEFCQEFMTDVRIPDSDRIGDVNQGWTVGTAWMAYERSYNSSPLVTRPMAPGQRRFWAGSGLTPLASRSERSAGRYSDQLIGEAHALEVVNGHLMKRIGDGMRTGAFNEHAYAVGRLYSGVTAVRISSIAFELAGAGAVAWSNDEEDVGGRGVGYLMRQASCMGGGTTEIARNVISERMLGMPREPGASRDTPFRDIPRSAPSR